MNAIEGDEAIRLANHYGLTPNTKADGTPFLHPEFVEAAKRREDQRVTLRPPSEPPSSSK